MSNRKRPRSPDEDDDTSYLVKETKQMAHKRREIEHQGLRALTQASVKEKEYVETPVVQELGDSYETGLEAHPLLKDSQKFDGVDLLPLDPALLPPEELSKLREAQRKQELENQLRLELMNQNKLNYRPGTAPRPKGP